MSRSDEHAVRERAHALWEAEGRPADRADDHWLQAEQDLGLAGSNGEPSVAALSQQQADGIDGGDLQGEATSKATGRGPAIRRKGADLSSA